MANGKLLDREEYIEQAYFFRVLRERLASNLATQDILPRIHEEILATTRLPYAIQFLATELKHSGLLSSGFDRLLHYFTPFQAFVIRQTEVEKRRLSMETALLILERQATYLSGDPNPAGLFVYQFESMSRNRLGYDDGLASMAADPFYDPAWRDYLQFVRRQLGVIDFGDLVYMRSQLYVTEQVRQDSNYEPSFPPLFGEKEGKIARANRCRDPLYLFAALQRQLGYPEVPRPQAPDDTQAKVEVLTVKLRTLEARLHLLESEVRGQIDLTQLGKPELLKDLPEDD
jgi:hypothetical protein